MKAPLRATMATLPQPLQPLLLLLLQRRHSPAADAVNNGLDSSSVAIETFESKSY